VASKGRRALVSGACGFIGSHLVQRLLTDGWSVTGVDALTEYYPATIKRANWVDASAEGGECRLVEADLNTVDLAPLVDGVDTVFHQAAQPGIRSSWGTSFHTYLADNVAATQRLLEACKAGGVRKFVYASSSSVYGRSAGYPTVEWQVPQPLSPYGVTKLAGEHLVSLYGRAFGLSTVSLRYHTVYGPRQRPDMAIERLFKAAAGGRPFRMYGSQEFTRDLTFVSDVVDANVRAATVPVPPGGVFNVAGGSEVSIGELVLHIGQLVGAEVPLELHPRRPGDVERTGADISLARDQLGWQPRVGLDEGLEAQWRVLRERLLLDAGDRRPGNV
jgi:nucleoside-diphosphate-sugar epimerase